MWLKGYAHIEMPRAEYAQPAKKAKRYYNELQQYLEQLRYGLSTMGLDDSVGIKARDAFGEYRACPCQQNTLRSWHRAEVINNFDVLFTSPDKAREMAKLQAMTDKEIKKWATNWINAVSEDEMLNDEEDLLFVAEEGNLP
ncbi:hypothetical protein DL768_010951 [Monosporascus sp. mg162]|nr:hypothetical protein DL768_010951 [Monosporascus sp. mg162]